MTPDPVRVSLDASAVPSRPTGAGRYVLDLTAALAEHRDVELTIVCRRGDEPRWQRRLAADDRAARPEPAGHGRAGGGRSRDGWTDDGRPGGRLAGLVVGAAPGARPARLLWEQVWLPRLLSEIGPAVHHGPHYTMPERARVPKVVTIHDLTLVEHPRWHEPAKVAFFRRAIRVAAARADAIVAVSRATANRLEALYSPRAEVHVIPHGVDGHRFRPLGPDDTAQADRDRFDRARLGADGSYVLFVGTIEPRKDVATLVRAFDRLAPAVPELTLVIAGAPAWGQPEVEAAVAQATHRDRIRLAGYVSEAEKAALLRGAAVVAYPSLQEGFGLPALEALACGAPLVTTEGSAMEEVAGDAALLVPPSDVGTLAEAVGAAVEAGPGADARRRRGLEIAARHTWDASAAAHAAVYRSLA